MLNGPFTQAGTLFGKGSLPVIERKLAYNEERHRVISHNIANAQTRFYKTQDTPDAEFHDLLKKSIEARDTKHVKTFEMIHGSNVQPAWHGGQHYTLHETKNSVLRHGDNDVDMDREMTKLTRNHLEYQTFARLAKKQYELIRSAIRETA